MSKRWSLPAALILSLLIRCAGAAPNRSIAQIEQDLGPVDQQVYHRYPLADMVDPQYRDFFTRELSPVLQHHLDLVHELEQGQKSLSAQIRTMDCTIARFWHCMAMMTPQLPSTPLRTVSCAHR